MKRIAELFSEKDEDINNQLQSNPFLSVNNNNSIIKSILNDDIIWALVEEHNEKMLRLLLLMNS